jgi:hypothetical protein
VAKKKWYSYFVVTDEEGQKADSSVTGKPSPRRVEDVAGTTPEAAPAFDAPASSSIDLNVVYESAKIVPPPHGYTVLKIAGMLESEHISALPPDVRRKSVLVALDAAGVRIDEIVQDAVRRDRALDTYEHVLEKHLEDVRAKTAEENQQLEAQIARHLAELRGRIDANRQAVEREEREFLAWRAKKQQEEAAIARAVGYFVSENPVTTPGPSAKDKGDADVR